MAQRQLPQVRIFNLAFKDIRQVEKDVNDYVIDIHNFTGNIPEISRGGHYIVVKCIC